jgi:hypothetical protein
MAQSSEQAPFKAIFHCSRFARAGGATNLSPFSINVRFARAGKAFIVFDARLAPA